MDQEFHDLIIGMMGVIVVLVGAMGYFMRQNSASYRILSQTIKENVSTSAEVSKNNSTQDHIVVNGLLGLIQASTETNKALTENIRQQTEHIREQTRHIQDGFEKSMDTMMTNRRILEQNLGIFAGIPNDLKAHTATLTAHAQEQTAQILMGVDRIRSDLMDIGDRVKRTYEKIELMQSRLLTDATIVPTTLVVVAEEGGENKAPDVESKDTQV